MKPVAVREDGVVNPQIFQDLDHGQRCTRQDALLRAGRVKEANILVHVENVTMRQPLNILVNRDNLLEILVLAVAEDGVVNDYAVNSRVIVCFDEAVLKKFAIDFAQVKSEATITALVGGIHPACNHRHSYGRSEY